MPDRTAARREPVAIYSIGHSTRTLDAVVELLRAHGVRRLVDVRTLPRSRRNPQFNQAALPGPLAAAGVTYAHMPELGGLRKPRPDSTNTAWRNEGLRGYADYMQTPEFETSLAALIDQAGREPTAFMCAEAVPWRCHRSLLSDALSARGLEVRHILTTAPAEPHALTRFAHLDGVKVTYPAHGQQRELAL